MRKMGIRFTHFFCRFHGNSPPFYQAKYETLLLDGTYPLYDESSACMGTG